jgi:hypothetical protein
MQEGVVVVVGLTRTLLAVGTEVAGRHGAGRGEAHPGAFPCGAIKLEEVGHR